LPHTLRDGGEAGQPSLDLPEVEPDRLLEVLREVTGARDLRFAETPTRLGSGGEAVVDSFRLAAAPPGFGGALVLRRILPLKEPAQVRREAVAHRVLASQGFPVPRVLHAEPSDAALGAPFLVAERLPGRVLLQEVMRPSELAAHPARIPGIAAQALVRVPRLLGGLQARLHRLDPEPLRRGLEDAGFAREAAGFAGRLRRLEERIHEHGLDGLAAGLQWLRAHRPTGERDAICHGDFVFTNVCVEGGDVTGVFDWSSVAIADPAYDVAATLSRLTSNVPGLPALLARLTRLVQRGLARRYLSSYRRAGSAEPACVAYYEAYWLLHELVWSGEQVRAGGVPDDAIEHRWLHPETIDLGVAAFEASTGIRLEPLRSADGA
jgi:aminoglycoside phosphotransferase (APT) family kinase protein